MTDEQARALGERWINAGGGWGDGMLPLYPPQRHSTPDAYGRVWLARGKAWVMMPQQGPAHEGGAERPREVRSTDVPDFRDPATRGAALEVVRWRFNSRGIHVVPHVVGCWAVYDEDVRLGFNADRTYGWEEEALVAALEASP